MAIKGKDFKKAVTFIKEFLLKLPEDEDCAELRDGFNLVLLHMKKYFKTVWLRTQERQSSVKLRSSTSITRGLSPLTPYQDTPDHFQWKWLDLESPKGLSKSLPSDCIQTVPLILQAAKEGDVELINQLVEKDASCKDDVDTLGRTALMYAVHVKQNECVTTLLNLHANINTQANDGSTVLHRAVYDNNCAALEILLEHNPDVGIQDCCGRAPVHWASMISSSANMELLLRTDVNVNVRDRDGLTPAMWACRMDNTRHLELILNCESIEIEESDGIERDMNGRTWIHWAVRRTEPMKCLKKLITADTVAVRDNEGKTVLHMAAEQGSMEACRIILRMVGKSCLKETDNICRTCLHLAVINGHGEVVNLLLEEGANFEERDKHDATALDYANNKNLYYCSLILNSFSKHKNKQKHKKKEKQNHGMSKEDTERPVGDTADMNRKQQQQQLSNNDPEINNNSAIISRNDSPSPGDKHPKPPGQPRPLGRKITPPPPRSIQGEVHLMTDDDERQLDLSDTPSAPPLELEDDVEFANMHLDDNTNNDRDMQVDNHDFHPETNEDDDDAVARKELANGNTNSDSYCSDMSDRSIEIEMVVSDIEEEVVRNDAERPLEPLSIDQSMHARITPAIQVQPPYPPTSPPVRILQPQTLNQQPVKSHHPTSSPSQSMPSHHPTSSPSHSTPSPSHSMPSLPPSMSLPPSQMSSPPNQMHTHSMESKPTPSPRGQLLGSAPLAPAPAPLMQAKMQRQLVPLDGQSVSLPVNQGKKKKKKKKRCASEGALSMGPIKASGFEPINGGLGGRVLGGIASPLQPSSPRIQPKHQQQALPRPSSSQDSYQQPSLPRPSSSQDNSPRSPRTNTSWEIAMEPHVRQSPPAPPVTPRESRDSSSRQTEMPNLISGRRSRAQSSNEIDASQTIDLNNKDTTSRRHDSQPGFNIQGGRSLSSNTLPRKPGNRNMTSSGLPAPQPPGPRPLGI